MNFETGKEWITLTRRTNDPKLSWLRAELGSQGIANKIDGESFHAPILKVQECNWENAWEVLTPELDNIPDDDPLFIHHDEPIIEPLP